MDVSLERLKRAVEISTKPAVLHQLSRDLFVTAPSQRPLEEHIRALFDWLCRAQDATPDGGVSAWFDLTSGWAPSYPETTGYIIPTFLEYGRRWNDADARARALRMADWECEVQLASGAVKSGTDPASTDPAVFNTGQVLEGWIAVLRTEERERWRRSAERAAEWLVSVQDEDGAWRRHISGLVGDNVQTYNIRAARALAEAGRFFSVERWITAAAKNADWVLRQQKESGWFDHASFDRRPPLLHTVGYVIEGLIECGVLLERGDCIDAAERASRALARVYLRQGWVPGRLTESWGSAADWRCLTGEAQLALSWLRLFELRGDRRFATLAGHLDRDLMQAISLEPEPAEVRGAVKGSHPISGGYLRWSYPNWAAKFALDAFMLQARLNPSFVAEIPPARQLRSLARARLEPNVQRVRSWVRRAERSLDRRTVSRDDLRAQLLSCGVREGTVVMVHASMDELSRRAIELDARQILQLLEELVGERGTILMPTFPFSGKQLEYVLGERSFDVKRTPSQVGLLTELFRRRRGTIRSLHPTHSVAASGRQAEALLREHHEGTAFGRSSPFYKLAELEGIVVGLGVPLKRGFTLFHSAEELNPRVGASLFVRDSYEMEVRRADQQTFRYQIRPLRPDVRRDLGLLEKELLESGALRYVVERGFLVAAARADRFLETCGRLVEEGTYLNGG